QRDIGHVDRARTLDHPADGLGALRAGNLAGAFVAFVPVQALDVDAILVRIDAGHLARLAAVLAANHDHHVLTTDLHHSTSGASETIFMKLRSRSSRATGPKMRVPRGLFESSMITAAFSSKAMYVPSSRPIGFFVRTTTA